MPVVFVCHNNPYSIEIYFEGVHQFLILSSQNRLPINNSSAKTRHSSSQCA